MELGREEASPWEFFYSMARENDMEKITPGKKFLSTKTWYEKNVQGQFRTYNFFLVFSIPKDENSRACIRFSYLSRASFFFSLVSVEKKRYDKVDSTQYTYTMWKHLYIEFM